MPIQPNFEPIKDLSAGVDCGASGTDCIPALVALIFHITIGLAGAIFLLMFLFGGVSYMTAGGNDESVGKARKMMLNAAIGLLIVLASYGVGTWIINALTS